MIRAIVGALLGGMMFMSSGLSFAQAVPATSSAPVGFTTSVGANVTTYTGASIKAANAASFSFAPAANGSIYAQAPARYFNGSQLVPVQVAGNISATQASGAIGRALSKMFFPLQAGIAVYDLARELGYTLDNSSGSLSVGVTVPGTPGTEYSFHSATGWHASVLAAGSAYASYYGYTLDRCQDDRCYWFLPGGAPYTNTAASRGSGTGTPETTTPATMDDFINAIAAKSGWPSNSPVARALNDALRLGEGVELVPGTVTGPAVVQGPKSVEEDAAKKVEKDTKHKLSYDQNKVKQEDETTTTTTDKATGGVTTSTTKTDPATPKQPEDESATDTPLPDLPKLYTRKYPDGLGGVWDARKAELAATSLGSFVPSLMPDVPPGGQCPVWMLDLNMGHATMNYGSFDAAPPCWVWPFAEIIILISAALLARALIFGG